MINDLKADTMAWRQEQQAAKNSQGALGREELPGQHRPLLNEHGTHTSPANPNPPGTTCPPIGGSIKPSPAPQTSHASHRGSELPPRAATDSGYASLPQESAKAIASFPPINKTDGDQHESSAICIGDLPDHVSVADDAATIYSAAQDLDERQVNVYKSELADCLCKQVRSLGLNVEAKENIVDVLPNLLKNFALRLGQHASSRSENEVMYFIHKYRGLV
jgi:hypothetical protein